MKKILIEKMIEKLVKYQTNSNLVLNSSFQTNSSHISSHRTPPAGQKPVGGCSLLLVSFYITYIYSSILLLLNSSH
jgi:hypothetical protein